MHLGVVEVLPVRHLESIGEVLEKLFIEFLNLVFPVKLFIAVHKIKCQNIAFHCVIDIISVVVVCEIVYIVIL